MIKDFTSADVPDQSGKTFFITGANSGIGFEAAQTFASNGARVLLGCRSKAKGKAAVARIKDAHDSADVVFISLDLADLSSVKKAAETVLDEPKLDVLINNAGLMGIAKALTKDGFEAQFGINHLGHFALTGLLLPILEKTPHSRIVNISSVGHRHGHGDLYWDDINAEVDYHPQQRYYASKLANLLFTYELDRRLRAKGSSTIAVAAHPGGANTGLVDDTAGVGGLVLKIVTFLMRPIMNSSAQGAWPTELAATAPGVEGGQYFGPSRFGETSGTARQVDSTPESKDSEKARRLWDLSIEMTGIDLGV